SRATFPARDVAVVAVAPRRPIGAVGVEVVGAAALAGAAVVVRVLPGILREVLLQVGPVPAVGAEGTLAERGKALLRARIAAHVEPEGVERRPEELDLGSRGPHLRLLLLPDEARTDEGHQKAYDDHHDLHPDEREACAPCTP